MVIGVDGKLLQYRNGKKVKRICKKVKRKLKKAINAKSATELQIAIGMAQVKLRKIQYVAHV